MTLCSPSELTVQFFGLHKRTDAGIAGAFQSVLHWSASVPVSATKVMGKNGWVTLTGCVEWQYQRLFATNGVRHLLGVTRVSDQVIIHPTVSVTHVKSHVDMALNLTTVADPPDISVDVNDTVVTLSGTILSWDERDSAMNLAWGTPSVHSVIDKLKIVP